MTRSKVVLAGTMIAGMMAIPAAAFAGGNHSQGYWNSDGWHQGDNGGNNDSGGGDNNNCDSWCNDGGNNDNGGNNDGGGNNDNGGGDTNITKTDITKTTTFNTTVTTTTCTGGADGLVSLGLALCDLNVSALNNLHVLDGTGAGVLNTTGNNAGGGLDLSNLLRSIL